MKAYIPQYNIINAKNLDDALIHMADIEAHWTPIAGGTDLMVLLEAGRLPEGNYLSIWDLKELREIKINDDCIVIGAGTTFQDIIANETIQKEFPMMIRGAKVTGAVAIQSRGTIGGNIANASPAADTPPALLCYDAMIEVQSKERGTTWYDYSKFHFDYKQMLLKKDEIITKIKIPRTSKPHKDYYHKVGTREAQSISKICFAARAFHEGKTISEIRLAFGSVAAMPIRATQTEIFLSGKELNDKTIQTACAKLSSELSPLDDIRSTATYRKQVAVNLLRDFLCGIG